MLFIFFQLDLLVQLIEVPVGPDPDVAGALGVLEDLGVLALFARITGAITWMRVPSGRESTWSMIWSMVCWRITLPHLGQWGVPTRAQRRRR